MSKQCWLAIFLDLSMKFVGELLTVADILTAHIEFELFLDKL